MTKEESITLAQRYYRRDGHGRPAPIEAGEVQQLIQNAISLQDRQAKRSEVWKSWGTFIAALVAAVSIISQLFINAK